MNFLTHSWPPFLSAPKSIAEEYRTCRLCTSHFKGGRGLNYTHWRTVGVQREYITVRQSTTLSYPHSSIRLPASSTPRGLLPLSRGPPSSCPSQTPSPLTRTRTAPLSHRGALPFLPTASSAGSSWSLLLPLLVSEEVATPALSRVQQLDDAFV